MCEFEMVVRFGLVGLTLVLGRSGFIIKIRCASSLSSRDIYGILRLYLLMVIHPPLCIVYNGLYFSLKKHKSP